MLAVGVSRSSRRGEKKKGAKGGSSALRLKNAKVGFGKRRGKGCRERWKNRRKECEKNSS